MKLHLQPSSSRLLVLLLALLSHVILCLSFSTKEFAVRPTRLEKRTTASVYDDFLYDLHDPTTVHVPQGQEKFLAFGSGPSILGSDGFAGCIGVLIGGNDGTIIAHYANSAADLANGGPRLSALMKAKKGALGNARAYLFAEVDPHTHAWQSEKNNQILEYIVEDALGILTTRVEYIQPENLIDLDNFDFSCEPEIVYGGMLVKHPGGHRGGWEGLFVDAVLQKAVFEGQA